MISAADIPAGELVFSAIRSSGPGGQNVNKVATAIHLRFDVKQSSLPERVRNRLLALDDNRLTSEGVIVIKAQNHRTQEKNRQEALDRLDEMLTEAQKVRKSRKATRPTRNSVKRRLDKKNQQGQRKRLRGRPDTHD